VDIFKGVIMCPIKQPFKKDPALTSPNLRKNKRNHEPYINMLDGMLTIGQVSKLTGVNKTTLRYWERKFDKFLVPKRIEKSHRQYTLNDIEIVKIIKKLRDEEYLTIKGISLRLKTMYSQHEDDK
jgi:hypothetical protein